MNELNKKNGKPTFAFAALLRKDFLFLSFLNYTHILHPPSASPLLKTMNEEKWVAVVASGESRIIQ